MKKSFFVLIGLISLSFSAFADTNAPGNSGKQKYIPFIVQSNTVYYPPSLKLLPLQVQSNVTVVKVDYGIFSSFISGIRESVCKIDKNADVTMWLSIDSNGKLGVVSGGGQTGIEVTFHCNDSTNSK